MSGTKILEVVLIGCLGLVYGGNTICKDDDGSVTAVCYENEECCGDDNEKCCKVFWSTWVIAAIAIGGVVLVSIIIISIIACVQKMNKKKQATHPTGGQRTHVTSISDYSDPPPSYSMASDPGVASPSFNSTAIAQPPAYNSLQFEKKKPL